MNKFPSDSMSSFRLPLDGQLPVPTSLQRSDPKKTPVFVPRSPQFQKLSKRMSSVALMFA